MAGAEDVRQAAVAHQLQKLDVDERLRQLLADQGIAEAVAGGVLAHAAQRDP
jgi:hypothetical protein